MSRRRSVPVGSAPVMDAEDPAGAPPTPDEMLAWLERLGGVVVDAPWMREGLLVLLERLEAQRATLDQVRAAVAAGPPT